MRPSGPTHRNRQRKTDQTSEADLNRVTPGAHSTSQDHPDRPGRGEVIEHVRALLEEAFRTVFAEARWQPGGPALDSFSASPTATKPSIRGIRRYRAPRIVRHRNCRPNCWKEQPVAEPI
jgi:hypothetical protein